MANISLTDNTAIQASIDIDSPSSAFASSPASAIHFAESDVIRLLDQPIDHADLSSLCLGFTYNPSIKIDKVYQFSIGGSLSASFTVFRAPLKAQPSESAPNLFPNDPLCDDPIPLAGCCYTALQWQLLATAGAGEKASPYILSEGLSAKASASLYNSYPKTSGFPTLRAALVDAFTRYAIPSSRADVLALRAGQLFSYEATGTLTAKGKFDLLAALNPTVASGVTEGFGMFNLKAGPEVSVGGCLQLTSDFQVRIRRLDTDILRVGYYRKKGSTLSVTFDASASADATIGGFDLIAPIYKLLGSGATITKDWFEAKGAKDLANNIQDALTKAVQQKLSIALDAETDVTSSDCVAFLFDFHISQLDAQGLSAMDALIRGDISSLAAASSLPAGITKHTSALDRVRSTSHTLSVNFLGVLSYADISKYALESTAKYTENGEIALVDKATASEMSVTVAPLMASQQLHHVLADLFTATVSYHCVAGKAAPDFSATQQFYDYEHKSGSVKAAWFDELCRQFDKPHTLPANAANGPAWMNVLLHYQKAEAVLLLLNAAGHARPQSDFVHVGRRAVLAAIAANPEVAYLAAIAENQPYWNAIVNQDTGDLAWTMSSVQKTHFGMVCFAINSWASSMAKLSKLIEQMVSYQESHDGAIIPNDPAFFALRKQLAAQLKQVSAKLVDSWVPAWSTFAVYFCHPPSSGQLSLGFGTQSYTDQLA